MQNALTVFISMSLSGGLLGLALLLLKPLLKNRVGIDYGNMNDAVGGYNDRYEEHEFYDSIAC